jgi:hypothetical protein
MVDNMGVSLVKLCIDNEPDNENHEWPLKELLEVLVKHDLVEQSDPVFGNLYGYALKNFKVQSSIIL